MDNETTAQLLAAVDDHFDAVVDFAGEVVAEPSVTGEEGAAARRFAAWFADNGFEVEEKLVPEEFRDRFPAMAAEVDLGERPNVFGWLRTADPSVAPLVLSGHTDVVSPGPPELWDADPWEGKVRDGRLRGRGSLDMKGPICCALLALVALREVRVELVFDVEMQCVIAEERGGLGTLYALETEPTPSAVVVLEPTTGAICPASGGAVPFNVLVPGQAAHVCVPWTGASAFEHLIYVYDGLVDLEARRNDRLSHPLFEDLPSKIPFAVGKVQAGEWHASVPDQAVLTGRMGVLPGETKEEVRDELIAAVAEISAGHEFLADHPATVTWDNEGFPSWETDHDTPIVQALLEGNRAGGGEGRLGAVTYGCDAGHFALAGYPTVIYGPGDIAGAHLKNESLSLEEMRLAARTLAVGIARASERAVAGART